MRDAIGGAGGFEPGKGGGILGGPTSAADFEGIGNGRGAGLGGGLIPPASLTGRDGVGRRFASAGTGGLGAEPNGGFGAEDLGASELGVYEESLSAPVSTPPPLFFNFGIPPANRPPNCGASDAAAFATAAALSLLVLFALGIEGAELLGGGFNIPGTGGAPAAIAPPPPLGLSTSGAERSFVLAFLSPFPF